MKALTKIAATAAAIPVAGLIVLGGAGSAFASTCPAGQHWNEMGGGAGFCAPTFSGGGTGGSSTTDLGGTTPPSSQAPVYSAPVGNAPTRGTLQPAPVPPVQQAPIQQAPAPVYAPVQKTPVAQLPPQTSPNYAPDAGIQTSVQGAVSEPKNDVAAESPISPPAEAGQAANVTDASAARAPELPTTSASAIPSTVSTPSSDAISTQDTVAASEIAATPASNTQSNPIALIFTILGGIVLVGYAVFYTASRVRSRRVIASNLHEDS